MARRKDTANLTTPMAKPLAAAPVASSTALATPPPAGWGGPTTGTIGNPAASLAAKQQKAAAKAAAAAAAPVNISNLTPQQQIQFNQNQIIQSRTPQSTPSAPLMVPPSMPTPIPGGYPAPSQPPANAATAPQQPPVGGTMGNPIQQNAPSKFVPGADGPLLRGNGDVPMQWETDPITNAELPLPIGLTQDQYDSALTKDQRYVADDVLSTLEGPVGDDFRRLEARKAAIMAARNLRPDQKQRELEAVDREWSQQRYAVLMNPDSVLNQRRRESIRKNRESAARDADIERRAIELDTEREKERERIGKIAAKEVAVPGTVADPAAVDSHAQGLLSGSGANPTAGKIAPSDRGFYQRGASGGHFILVPDIGRVAAGVAPNGTMVAMPRNATEFAALPDGTMYLAVEDGARVPKMKGKAPKPIDRPEIVAAKVEPDIRKQAEERTKMADKFNDDRRKHELDVRKWAAARKAADATGDDMAVWDDAHPEPEAPEMPRELARAESEWRAANPGKPFDTSVVTDRDRREAEDAYWAKQGVRAADVPAMRGSDTLSGWERELDASGALVARSPVDGMALPLASAKVGGRQVIAVAPVTAAEAARAIADGLPVEYGGTAIAIERGSLAGKDDMTVARAVKRAFPRLSPQDMAEIADKLQKGAM